MNWGYHYFRKHPYVDVLIVGSLSLKFVKPVSLQSSPPKGSGLFQALASAASVWFKPAVVNFEVLLEGGC